MQSKTRIKNSKKRWIGWVLQKSLAPEEPMPKHRCIRWLSEDPTPWCLMQVWVSLKLKWRSCEAPVEPTASRQASVHWAYYIPETMSSAQEPSLLHWLNRWCIRAKHQCNDVSRRERGQRLVEYCVWPVELTPCHRLNRSHTVLN